VCTARDSNDSDTAARREACAFELVCVRVIFHFLGVSNRARATRLLGKNCACVCIHVCVTIEVDESTSTLRSGPGTEKKNRAGHVRFKLMFDIWDV
jgi:hypothetical protein